MKFFQKKSWYTSLLIGTAMLLIGMGCAQSSANKLQVTIEPNEQEQKVDVLIDGELFTSYIYSDEISVLKKPVLWPLQAPDGTPITRGYPLDPIAGERVDHPHHIGFWFNYGDVNGYDFWNNSDAITGERVQHMGTIKHRDIVETKNGESGILEVNMDWVVPTGETLLKESTKFVFQATPEMRIIDRITTLTAQDKKVSLKDNKEGVLGIRVTRALEHPSKGTIEVTDASGQVTEVPAMANEDVSGEYLSSEGIRGNDVWGTRAKWVKLSGTVQNTPVTLAILDHPDNVGYPTYWHARGYGLFAANPLGQAALSDGKDVLDFSLDAGESTTFRHRIVVLPGIETAEQVEEQYQTFVKAY